MEIFHLPKGKGPQPLGEREKETPSEEGGKSPAPVVGEKEAHVDLEKRIHLTKSASGTRRNEAKDEEPSIVGEKGNSESLLTEEANF